jgi:hypothetical protein
MVKHLYIPDTQVKAGVPLEHLTWAGMYIMDKRPDVIILAGDFVDMESLSSYDKGKKCFEGRRYEKDVKVCHQSLEMLFKPLNDYNAHQRKIKGKQYKPRKVITLGNHEDRINRAINDDPKLEGLMCISDLGFEKHGLEVVPFLEVIEIDGVMYSHYFYNPNSGRPYSGEASNRLKNVGFSFVQGHEQGLRCANKELPKGGIRWGIIAGSFYQHDENYKGAQGNHHWRGVVMLHEVKDGNFDPMFVSLNYLKNTYGESKCQQ